MGGRGDPVRGRARATLTPRRPPSPATFLRTQYAFIKRVGDTSFEDEAFAAIELRPADTVALLVGRACEKFEWGVPTKVHLHLAAAGGAERPTPAELAAMVADPTTRLSENWLLPRAGIAHGCWLLARVPPPAAASSGSSHLSQP